MKTIRTQDKVHDSRSLIQSPYYNNNCWLCLWSLNIMNFDPIKLKQCSKWFDNTSQKGSIPKNDEHYKLLLLLLSLRVIFHAWPTISSILWIFQNTFDQIYFIMWIRNLNQRSWEFRLIILWLIYEWYDFGKRILFQ